MEVSDEDVPPAKAGRARKSGKSGKASEGKAKGRAPKAAPPTELVVELSGTGMTPLLRAGAGGLAAALRALVLEADPRVSWPAPVAIADGTAVVEPRRVVLRFGPKGPEALLNELFARVFRLTPDGVVCPMGTFEPSNPPSLGLAIALQLGMKRTFLQHGRSTTKAGAARAVQVEIDERMFQYVLQPYAEYVHREGAASILDAIKAGHVELAGWAYPGAAQRHVGFSESRCEYGAAEALSAMFALVGCLSYPGARGGTGVLVVPVPDDLVEFARLRPRLSPRRVVDTYVTGVGDAVLAMSLALRLADVTTARRGIGDAVGWLLRVLPWAKQQKSRAWTIESGVIADARLDAYERVTTTLPSLVRESKDADEDGEDVDGFFVATSALRGFVTDNLAQGLPWFHGFATATTGGKKPRFIHYFRERDGGLGALYPEEKKGLIAMLDDLDDAQKVLVRSVHLALRGRFARIASEADNAATMKNRFSGERERLRLAFAGAKTADQVRGALADLWSRGGTNRELQASWEQVLPLLRPERWQVARDLALVALASYQGASKVEEDDDEPGTQDDGGR